MQSVEERLAIVENEQNHLSEEMVKLSASIDKLTIAVNSILQKGSSNWDKLMWLIGGAVVTYVFSLVVRGWLNGARCNAIHRC